MKLKIQCQGCRGEGAQEYDNEIGHAVQSECSTCEGKGHLIINAVPFGLFADAVKDISAVPVYDEKLVAGDSFQPFELHMRWFSVWSEELRKIMDVSESFGLEAHLICRGNEGMSFYFTNKPITMSTQPKYDNIKFGEFQPLEVITADKDKTSTIGRIKSRIELCDIVNYTFDEETGMCEIYYRATGESDMPYMIEAVKRNGKDVKYSGRDEQNILNWLEEKFPAQPKRNPLSPPDWWLDNYTDASGNCYSDADEGL